MRYLFPLFLRREETPLPQLLRLGPLQNRENSILRELALSLTAEALQEKVSALAKLSASLLSFKMLLCETESDFHAISFI